MKKNVNVIFFFWLYRQPAFSKSEIGGGRNVKSCDLGVGLLNFKLVQNISVTHIKSFVKFD